MAEPFIISADGVVPMTGPGMALLEPAGVVVNGERIVAVGVVSELRRKYGEIAVHHSPGVMLPGFVNAHTHLELSYQSAGEPPAHFTRWVGELMKRYPGPEERDRVITAAVRKGAEESLGFGVTCVGDISRNVGLSRGVLAGGPLRVVSYGEVVGLGKMRDRMGPMLEAAADATMASATLRVGVSPHAPYTVEMGTLKAIVARAIAEGLPVAMHLAELEEERQFLADLSGPLGREWDVMAAADILDGAIPGFTGGPIRWAEACGLLDAAWRTGELPVLLAHVNYATDEEIAMLAEAEVSVVYCPRTRAYFGHDEKGRHRYREMLEAGVNVALGTDSLASNPDLSILREAAFLWRRDGIEPYDAMELITERGSQALGLREVTGTIAVGKQADVIVLPVEMSRAGRVTPAVVDGLLARILEEAPLPGAVWVGGRRAR